MFILFNYSNQLLNLKNSNINEQNIVILIPVNNQQVNTDININLNELYNNYEYKNIMNNYMILIFEK